MRRIALLLLTLTLAAACTAQMPASPPTPLPAPVTASLPSSPTTTANLLLATDTPLLPDATVFPNPALYTWETVASGLERPVDIQSASTADGRLFIVEKAGRIRILQDGQVLSVPFLDITERVGSQGNEQGLLGLAFHPRYVKNGFFYVNYTDRDGNTVIARFQASPHLGLAEPASESILLCVNQPFPNHNGGALTFGADGLLYAGLGDGGSSGDPFGNAQNLNSLLGKILRLNVDSAKPYAVPPGNISGSEVWAYGLRNPWRIAFDRVTGDLYIGDVGQNKWEEIDFVAAGTPGLLNFGWDYLEGTHAYDGFPPLDLALIAPVAEYGHNQGCSVTGGVVYRGAMPEWQGIYLYADYCRGTIWGLLNAEGQWQAQVLFETRLNPTSFGQDQAGKVYLASDSGQVLRLVRR